MKVSRFLLMLIGIIFGLIIFASCGDGGTYNPPENPNNTEVTLISTNIISTEIVSYPYKTEYLLNETFDPTGLQLKLVYEDIFSDRTTKQRTVNIAYPDENLEFSVPDFSTFGEKQISLTYNDGDFCTEFYVYVIESTSNVDPENPTLIITTLDSISIKTLPTKTEYKVNEDFDPTGLEITAIYTNYYSDNSTMSYSNDISYDNNMTFSGTDFSTVGTKIITVTYTENETSQFATFEITVKAAAFSSTINYTTFDSEINSDLSIYNGKAMTLYLDTTTVNIAKLYEQYTAISSKVGEKGSVSISYADAANTTIEGELYMNNHLNMNAVNENRYANIKSFVNAIKSSVLNSNSYPTMNMSMTSRTMSDATPFNLYHTDIADLLNLYYNNNMGDKISSFSVSSSAEFDAIDYLNGKGGIAYDAANQYTGNYYDIDVNAALLMNANLKNVNVTGAVSGEKNTFEGTFTNVRFGEDTTGFTFSDSAAGIGLIEFAGDAPSVTPRVNAGRLVLRNASSKVSFQGGFSIDVSGISDENAIHTNINHSAASFTEAIYPTQETANTSKFTPSSIRVDNNLVSGPDYYATNQQWVKAANEDKWNEYGEKKYPNKDLLSKAKLDEKNNTLLNTILFNNQKVYNS